MKHGFNSTSSHFFHSFYLCSTYLVYSNTKILVWLIGYSLSFHKCKYHAKQYQYFSVAFLFYFFLIKGFHLFLKFSIQVFKGEFHIARFLSSFLPHPWTRFVIQIDQGFMKVLVGIKGPNILHLSFKEKVRFTWRKVGFTLSQGDHKEV